jgi:hypothetical protein
LHTLILRIKTLDLGMRQIVLVVLLVVLIGCSKLDAKSYSQIKVGMSLEEVSSLIGTPNQCDAVIGVMTCNWGDKTTSVKIQLVQDKVIFMSAEGL